ncbi:MAG: DUF882 domain-containing protein [Syntrophorhabdales bacterium]|jgi:uncharacterized protein YcbK (DUF882 family)
MMTRRHFLKSAAAVAGACQLGGIISGKHVFAFAGPEGTPEKVLSLYNIHTGERLHTRYCVDGCNDQSEIERIWHLLRCHYSNVVKPIDIRVIDLLCKVKDRFGREKEISIVSGYRSPEYNEYLRGLGRHVAAGSLHMAGLAIDFTLPGVGTKELSKTARQFAAGGVGLYPDFVHIDVGRVRYW